ncbi:MAG: hypothetical protein J3R72DRAFT_518837 [Linnemannia gamsii]|nr:MAG: hypothetical protein J3R72DRAFT_518837 [Linnemannia gamsii]
MKRRSVLATIPRCYVLLTLLAIVLDSFVSAGGLTHRVQVPKSTVVAPLDAAAMEMLCSDQIGMCTVSCQSKVQENSCDAKTLTWTCTCKNGTRSSFGDWQLPVPFQLCRRQLSSCLQQCESSQQQALERERKATAAATVVALRERSTNDIEQETETETMDMVDEFQLARHSARLQAASFSRNNNLRQQQKKLGHTAGHSTHKHILKKSKQAARKRALEQSPAGAEATIGPDKNKVPAPAAYSLDPPVPRDPICSAQCARQFSCGTRSAPEYHNLNDFLASSNTPDSHPNSKDGASAADAKQRNSRNNGPDSGKLFELRLSKLTSVAIAIASIIAAQHVTR